MIEIHPLTVFMTLRTKPPGVLCHRAADDRPPEPDKETPKKKLFDMNDFVGG
jgi:hypothetical protein